MVSMKNNIEKEERFKRLASYRTNVVIKALKVLSNCSNRSTYTYSETDIKKIFKEINDNIKIAKAKFHYPTSSKKFKL